jgi:hypothetical protein
VLGIQPGLRQHGHAGVGGDRSGAAGRPAIGELRFQRSFGGRA